MNRTENFLAGFHPTTLEDLNVIKLLKRYDTKFIFHRDRLKAVFDFLAGDYQILEMGDHRAFDYETLYYDTDDYFFYYQHHNRKLNRYKVRCRRYANSNECYFEVKFKNNKRKTIKSRLPLKNGSIHPELSEYSLAFAKECFLNGDCRVIDQLKPKLKVEYNRITFSNLARKERLTVDTDLTFVDRSSNRHRIDNLIIAELKSDRLSMNGELFRHLKGLKIFPAKFSKYCMGIALTVKDVKRNRFKRNLLKIERLS